MVTTTGAGSRETTAFGRSSGMVLVDCEARVRWGRVGVAGSWCAGGGSGADVPAIAASSEAPGGGTCSAVSTLSLFWAEHPTHNSSSKGTTGRTVRVSRLGFMTLLSIAGARPRPACRQSSTPFIIVPLLARRQLLFDLDLQRLLEHEDHRDVRLEHRLLPLRSGRD